MAGSHRRAYSLKVIFTAVAAVCSAIPAAPLHAQQYPDEQRLPEVKVRG